MNPYRELEVIEIRQETPDAKSFVLRAEGGEPIIYQPGQFLTLVFPAGDGEARRSYSISSCAFLSEPLTITVKRIDNGAFSRYLFDDCRVGSKLSSIGASGLFTLPEDVESYDSLIFFAAGSGITPVRTLIKSALHQYSRPRIHLVYSNRSRETTMFGAEFERMEKDHANRLSVTHFYSDAKNLLQARLSKSLVADILHREGDVTRENILAYLCGPHTYMQMISITLLAEGLPAANIRKEIFDTVKPVVRDLPPDQDEHLVTIRYRGESHVLTVKYPDTILSAAQKTNIFLPYSCEAGKCGTCAATCSHGKVWMAYNEVLSDRELTKGRVLTCTGHPVGGDVVLDIE